MEKLEEVDYNPKCPYCDVEIDHLNVHRSEAKDLILFELKAKLGIFSCPNCRRLLGTASLAWGEK